MLLGVVGVPILSSCSADSSAALRTLRLAVPAAESVPPSAAGRAYLRVRAGGAEAYLALAYLEAQADGSQQEVWYSSAGEVIRLNNGRLAGTTGLPQDWRQVRYEKRPEWNLAAEGPRRYSRWHDEMPGYRMNVREELQLQRIPPPMDVRLLGVAPALLTWFEESVLQTSAAERLPPARYALLSNGAVVYAEQCFSPDYCLNWQKWPLPFVPQAAAEGAGQ